jgi:hypothetical protein
MSTGMSTARPCKVNNDSALCVRARKSLLGYPNRAKLRYQNFASEKIAPDSLLCHGFTDRISFPSVLVRRVLELNPGKYTAFGKQDCLGRHAER